METFIVSARKYRPSTFQTVVGQDSIVGTLKNAIKNNHLAQAFLFCEPRGVGKTTCARILAKTINCSNLKDNTEACNECESCKSFNGGQSLNIHELDAASHNSVDDIRNLVDQVRFAPQSGAYKIYIIDEVHMLSQSAFNAFLKTLEEPPPYAIFILATTEKHKIIPTILSRCQIFDFNRIRIEDIAKQLATVAEAEHIKADADALHLIAQKADGAMRDALSIFDQIVSFSGGDLNYEHVVENLNILDYDYFFKIVDQSLNGDIPGLLLTFDEILNYGFDGHNFVNGLGDHVRNLLVCKDPSTLKLLEVGESIKTKYAEQSNKVDNTFLYACLNQIHKADAQYKSHRNQRLLVELLLINLCKAGNPDLTLSTQNQPVKQQKSLSAQPEKQTTEKKTEPKTEQPVKKSSPEAPVKETISNEPAIVKPEKTNPPVPVEQKKPQVKTDLQTKTQSQNPAKKSKTLSINQFMEGDEKKDDAIDESESDEQNDLSSRPSDNFTIDDLLKVWNEYADTLKESNPSFYSTLTKTPPTLEGTKIVLSIDNKVQEDELSLKKSDLLGYLREKLNNYQTSLEAVINTSVDKSKAYTPKDKYQKMVKENPTLDKLKQQLDLDIDF